MANIDLPDFLNREQLRAFTDLLEARAFEENAIRSKFGNVGMWKDYKVNYKDPLFDVEGLNSPTAEQYFRGHSGIEGRMPTDEELRYRIEDWSTGDSEAAVPTGVLESNVRVGNKPPDIKILGMEGDVINPRNLSFEEYMARNDAGLASTYNGRRVGHYLPMVNPESVDMNIVKSYFGRPSEQVSQFMREPHNTLAGGINGNFERPILPSRYDPRFHENRLRQLDIRTKHYEALFNKFNGAPYNPADIWTITEGGHNDLLIDPPKNATEAYMAWALEKQQKDDAWRTAAQRRAQYERQLLLKYAMREDPQLNVQFAKVFSGYKDIAPLLGIKAERSIEGSRAAGFERIDDIVDWMGRPLSDDETTLGMQNYNTLSEYAQDVWANHLLQPAGLVGGGGNYEKAKPNMAKVLPVINAMVKYNQMIDADPYLWEFAESHQIQPEKLESSGLFTNYDSRRPINKGGYLGFARPSVVTKPFERLYDYLKPEPIPMPKGFKGLLPKGTTVDTAATMRNAYLNDPAYRKVLNSQAVKGLGKLATAATVAIAPFDAVSRRDAMMQDLVDKGGTPEDVRAAWIPYAIGAGLEVPLNLATFGLYDAFSPSTSAEANRRADEEAFYRNLAHRKYLQQGIDFPVIGGQRFERTTK